MKVWLLYYSDPEIHWVLRDAYEEKNKDKMLNRIMSDFSHLPFDFSYPLENMMLIEQDNRVVGYAKLVSVL